MFEEEPESLDRSASEHLYWLATARLTRQVRVVHVSPGARTMRRDMTAAEEPLQIRLCGKPFAVVMRTPGSDPELTAGFLFAERVVHEAGDVGTIAADPEAPNTLDVMLAGRRAADLPRLLEERRAVIGNSACGLCGRLTIESLRAEAPDISATWTISPELMPRLPERLRASQQIFDATGGLHAAGLFDRTGRLTAYAEDVGRHNAVDKLLGRRFLDADPSLGETILVVSGRAGFEIVQKALVARVSVLVAVGAPSSLAVESAEKFGMTLVGFASAERFNVYSAPQRVSGGPASG
jgi:FdhD protein